MLWRHSVASSSVKRPKVSITCDVHMIFEGQPLKIITIPPGDKAMSEVHAIKLAMLNAQAAGWDLKRLQDVKVVGVIEE